MAEFVEKSVECRGSNETISSPKIWLTGLKELNCVLMVAFHNGHKLNRKSHWLGTDPKAAQHTSSTATTMGEQRQQQQKQKQRVKLGVHFVLSRGGGDRSKEATASMQSPSLRCYINLIQKRRHAAHASYSWVYSYVNDGSRRSWRRLQMEEEEQEEEGLHTLQKLSISWVHC